MADELQTYLNDHMAGSLAGVKILEYLGAASEAEAERQFFADLLRDIEEDRNTLAGLIERAGGERGVVREAGAWISEKLMEAKLRYDDPGGDGVGQLEALEALGLGILGKRALWRVLGAVSGQVSALQGTDFLRLETRAQDQHDRVEARRLATGRRIFGRGAGSASG